MRQIQFLKATFKMDANLLIIIKFMNWKCSEKVIILTVISSSFLILLWRIFLQIKFLFQPLDFDAKEI